jgi:arylsulfatase A-like enzyme
MARRGRYKYMEHSEQGQPVLFDLEVDPLECTNLVGDAAYRDVVDELADRLRNAMRQPILDVPAT